MRRSLHLRCTDRCCCASAIPKLRGEVVSASNGYIEPAVETIALRLQLTESVLRIQKLFIECCGFQLAIFKKASKHCRRVRHFRNRVCCAQLVERDSNFASTIQRDPVLFVQALRDILQRLLLLRSHIAIVVSLNQRHDSVKYAERINHVLDLLSKRSGQRPCRVHRLPLCKVLLALDQQENSCVQLAILCNQLIDPLRRVNRVRSLQLVDLANQCLDLLGRGFCLFAHVKDCSTERNQDCCCSTCQDAEQAEAGEQLWKLLCKRLRRTGPAADLHREVLHLKSDVLQRRLTGARRASNFCECLLALIAEALHGVRAARAQLLKLSLDIFATDDPEAN